MSYEKTKKKIDNISGEHSKEFDTIVKEFKIKTKDITDKENYVEFLDFIEGLISQLKDTKEKTLLNDILNSYEKESGYNKLKESYSFNEYLEFLTEGVNDKDFTPEVKEVLEELPYVTFKNDLGKYASAKLEDVKRIGTYSCNIYPNSSKDIAVTISLKDGNEYVTLAERMFNFEDAAWEKNFKKFINEARKIVEKLSELNQAE